MCGIAGFSLNKNSKVNARALAHHLLTQIEWRGSHASGFAYKQDDGTIGYYKDAIAGSNLPLRELPRDAKTAIMHTRFATHGPVTDNRNNHPVLSPNEEIALVHNGVIWNHTTLRFGILDEFTLPMVDTSVIPALIQKGGPDALQNLMGDAAIAWLDSEENNTLHLARVEGNPISWTQLFDGSIVWASTQALLRTALKNANLEHGVIFDFMDSDYFKLDGGVIVGRTKLPKAESMYDRGYGERWRNATSGGHGSTATTTPTVTRIPAVNTVRVNGVEVDATTGEVKPTVGTRFAADRAGVTTEVAKGGNAKFPNANVSTYYDSEKDEYRIYNTDTKKWEPVVDEADLDAILEAIYEDQQEIEQGQAMALTDGAHAWEELDTLPLGIPVTTNEQAAFYTIDRDDNLATYNDLDELEKTLLWHAARLVGEDLLGDQESKWVNVFSDIGSFGWADDEMISWVKEPSQISFFEDAADDGLGYVRDGVEIIKQMVGR